MLVVGLGAGGHAKVVIEILRLGGYEFIGLLDPKPELKGTLVAGVQVLGDDSLLPELYQQGLRAAFIGVGMIGTSYRRQEVFSHATERGFEIVSAIHPQAIVSPSARIDVGPTIMAGAIINADATIGRNVIVNTGAIVEHECVIADHAHIATGAKLAGGVKVGIGSHIGIGAVIKQGVRIGSKVVVGAGAVVLEDVRDDVTVVGVPARILNKR